MINNIANNTFSSAVQDITQSYGGINMTTGQGYCLILSFAFVASVLIFCIYKIIIAFIVKSDCCCNSTKENKKAIKELKGKYLRLKYDIQKLELGISKRLDKVIDGTK